jgi:hypothetical protein
MTFLDGFLDPCSKDPAFINGVRISIMKPTVFLVLHSIRPKHIMPLWQLDSAFFYQEFKEFIRLGHIKVIGALGLFDPPLIHCHWLLAPHNFSCSYFLFVVIFLTLICSFEELIVYLSYIIVFDEPCVFLEAIRLIAH